MKFRRQGDLAMIETAAIGAAAGLIGLLLVPRAFAERERFPILQAQAEVQRIAAGILEYREDTGEFPIARASGERIEFLKGPGEEPKGLGGSGASAESLSSFLAQNPDEREGWKGPYLRGLNPDPWGRCYVVNASSFDAASPRREKVWALSAGPNGRIDTGPTDVGPQGDDVGAAVN